MNNIQDLILFIDRLIAKNCPFALWSIPGSNAPEILISSEEELIYPDHFNKLNGQEGFIFAPYQISEYDPLVLLKPGIYRKGFNEILGIDCSVIQNIPSSDGLSNRPFIISRENYLKDVTYAIDEIKKTKLAKVIISRLIPVARMDESIGNLYAELLRQTPDAFIYLVNLPGIGLWMGATPEVLLKSEGKMMETLSLAGTQARDTGNEYRWHTKEIEEQAFVSRYLLDVFYRFNIHPYITEGPETLESGKVAHLCTSFRFASKKLACKLGDFIIELHPTPAVCGYPKQKAAKFIQKIEKHNRRYYSGYLGSWQLDGNVELFVNLRCMEILPRQYILYSGGGITSRSVPENEWEETEKKATTLLSAIEAVQKK